MCSRLRPMEVVCVLNAMYVAFDQLCDKHHVYKVSVCVCVFVVLVHCNLSPGGVSSLYTHLQTTYMHTDVEF